MKISLGLIAVTPVISAAKHGLIGYGINMYHPWCGTACSDDLGMVYLNCTTFPDNSDMDGMDMKLKKRMDGMDMSGVTSPECYASSVIWLQTLSYCIKTHCDKEGISETVQEKYFQQNAAAGLPVPSLKDSLPPVAPTEELDVEAIWLNKTMLANEGYYDMDRGTIQLFEQVEETHSKFSITVVTLSIGMPLLTGLWAYSRTKLGMSALITQLQSYIALPALFGQKHSQPLAFAVGYLPDRAMAINLATYVILNVLFCAVPYRSVQPNSWYVSRTEEIGIYIANRTGVLSFANMALAILFSTRNNPLAYLSGWSHTSFLTFHRWAARMAILQAVIHSILYTADRVSWAGVNTLATEAASAYWWWGIIATIAMSLMVGFSAFPVRVYAYEFFLITHIVLAIMSLLGCWYHVQLRFDQQWGYEVWLYIAFAFWSYDRLFRFGKVMYYSLLGKSSATATLIPGTNVVSLKVYPAKSWTAGPGGHTFLYFPSSGKFWENHPFTIADWSSSTLIERSRSVEEGATPQSDSDSSQNQVQEKGGVQVSQRILKRSDTAGQNRFYVQCYFRAHKGTTAKIYQHLSLTQATAQMSVLSEGPYGSHTTSHLCLKQANKVLCIAGGIGITWAAGFAKQFALERLGGLPKQKSMMPQARHFIMAWSVREQALLEHIKDNLLPDLTASGLDDGSLSYRFWLTGERGETSGARKDVLNDRDEPETQGNDELVATTMGRRMDVDALLSSFMEKGKRHAVLVCGPGGLADSVRSSAVACSEKGYFIDLVEEPFAW